MSEGHIKSLSSRAFVKFPINSFWYSFLAFIQPDLAVVPKATSLQSRQTAVAFFKSTVLLR